MPTRLEHTIRIARPREAVFDFVTQPWRWCEWHPASRHARAEKTVLAPGDVFDEEIELRPLGPFPLRLRRATRYEVLEAERPGGWRARGEAGDGWLEIEYRLEPDGEDTRFTRRLAFEVRGALRLLGPLLRARVERQSREALENLRACLEAGSGPG